MNKQIDWNCKLLPGFTDQIGNEDDAISAMKILFDNHGFTDFFFFPKFDPAVDSAAYFQLRANSALSLLNSRLPFAANLYVRPAVYLRSEIPDEAILRRFCIPKSNYLALSMPITPDETTENGLARFVRHTRFRVLLLDAQILPIFYTNEVLERILNLPGIALQITISALYDPKFAVFLHKIVQKGVPILLGSGVNSLEKAYQIHLDQARSTVATRLSDWEINLIFNGKLPRA